MKYLPIVLLIAISFALSAQTEKGATPISPSTVHRPPSTEIFAVVVGISDYQDESIPDLRFADKDALAFAGFLQSPAGGSLDEDHLQVLINEQATHAQFARALDWLWEVAGENDRAIIYFSGHGDVEKKSLTQSGFLLCWDAPARVYMAGGAFPLSMLQEVISTISIQNKAKVTMIADACRAGKLSGSNVSGSQLTNSNLARQYANEIKILSCQPDEYSIEGEQWGGGRGAFSYHLLNGLYGLADGNSDGTVSLTEIDRYLEDHVTVEVAPQNQLPMTIGNGREKLYDVFPELLAKVKEEKIGQLPLFAATDSRGFEEDVLAQADSGVVKLYEAFKKSLADKQFLEPANACADFYYDKLSQEPQLERLHSSLRRNYAAALQDDAQQVLNIILKSGLTEKVLKNVEASVIYKHYPDYLERAAELLGAEHYMYQLLQARKHFFEGKMQKIREVSRASYHKALSLQPDMAHAMVELIRNFEADQLDSAKHYFEKATDLVPSWIEPYIAMGYYYNWILKQPKKQLEMLNLAGQIDSTSVLVWYEKSRYYSRLEINYPLAEKWLLKTVEGVGADICFPCVYNNLGALYIQTNRFDQAEQAYKKAIQFDSTFTTAYINLGDIANRLNRTEEAEQYLKKALQIDSTFIPAIYNLGNISLKARRYEEAEKYFKKGLIIDSMSWVANYGLADFYMARQDWEEALPLVQKAIELAPSFVHLQVSLGNIYTHLPDYFELAAPTLNKALETDPDLSYTHICLAQLALKNKDLEDAWRYLEQGLEKDVSKAQIKLENLKSNPDFAAIKKEPRWNALMEKYFPEEFKN